MQLMSTDLVPRISVTFGIEQQLHRLTVSIVSSNVQRGALELQHRAAQSRQWHHTMQPISTHLTPGIDVTFGIEQQLHQLTDCVHR